MPKKQLHIDLSDDLHAALRERAKYEQRSIGAETRVALSRHLVPDREPKPEPVAQTEAVLDWPPNKAAAPPEVVSPTEGGTA